MASRRQFIPVLGSFGSVALVLSQTAPALANPAETGGGETVSSAELRSQNIGSVDVFPVALVSARVELLAVSRVLYPTHHGLFRFISSMIQGDSTLET